MIDKKDYLIYVIIGILAIIIIITYKNQENAGSIAGASAYSAEAVQNIAKVYADTSGTATFNNINATGNITGNLRGNVTGNVTGNIAGNVVGNVTGNVTGNLMSPNGNYKLSIDNSGIIHVLNQQNNEMNITPATGFKGKLISLDETTYILSNPTTGGSGLIIGYDVRGSGVEDTVAGVKYKFARNGA